MEKTYDVFISFKNTKSNGDYTEDSKIARELYDAFKSSGLQPFYSEESLGEIGSSDYTKDIDNAIKNAKAMVVVLTKAEYAESRWVEKEWQAFEHYYLNNVREGKNLFTLTKKVAVADLPITLASVENFDYKNGIDPVVKAIHAIAEKPVSRRYIWNRRKVKMRSFLIGMGLFLIFAAGVLAGHFGTCVYDMIFSETGTSIQPSQDSGNNQNGQNSQNTIQNGQVGVPGDQTSTGNTAPTIGLEIVDKESASASQGASRETAISVTLNTTYTCNLNSESDVLWCKFKTGSKKAVHRLMLTPNIAKEDIDRSRGINVSMGVYDSMGILLKEINIAYFGGDPGYLDMSLNTDAEYYIKYALNKTEDNVEYSISLQADERPCDVDIAIENATALTLGQKYEAVLDSTFPEYFVFTPEKGGQYMVTLHNINTGTDIDIYCGTKADMNYNGWSASAKNENRTSYGLYLSAGYPHYFKVYTNKYETNGKYIIVVEEKK